MTERVPSDHDAVASHRTRVGEVGRTGRPRIPLPEAVDAAIGDVVRLSLDGETFHAQVRESLEGEVDLRGAFVNARLARTDGEGTDHLRAWVERVDVRVGDPLVLDVVTPGFLYGVRRPGERVVYDAADPPSASLADIARDIDG